VCYSLSWWIADSIVIAIIASIIASVISYRKGIEFRKKKAEPKLAVLNRKQSE